MYFAGEAGANLNTHKDDYILPWTQLDHDLKNWDIEMLNWPKDVIRDDGIRGISGLIEKDVRSLWDAIHDTDAEKQLQFRRIERQDPAVESTTRKRRVDPVDDNRSQSDHAPKRLKFNIITF